MTGTGTQTQTQTWTTGVTTIALLVLRTGKLKIDKELDFVTEFVHLFATIDIVVQEMRTVSEKLNVLFPLAASTNKCTVCKKIVSQHHRTC